MTKAKQEQPRVASIKRESEEVAMFRLLWMIFIVLRLAERTELDNPLKGGIGTPLRSYRWKKRKGQFKPITDKFIDLRDRRLKDISHLSGAVNITELILSNNKLTDISPLSVLINLQKLYLDKNKISDLVPLCNLPNLTHLFLSDNQITDISVLGNFAKLETLELNNNLITDISCLYSLTNLRILKLRGNTISGPQTEELKAALRKCQIYF
jgi:hypothetical protein